MNDKTPAGSINKTRVFLIGTFATVLLYALYYLKNDQVIYDFLDRRGAAGGFIAGIALVVLASASGLWAVICGSRTLQAAFTIGLGLPSILATAMSGLTASSPAMIASMVPAVSFQEDEDRGLIGEALEIVFSPVSAAEQVRHRRRIREIGELNERVGRLAEEKEQLAEERERLAGERDSFRGRLDRQEQELVETRERARVAQNRLEESERAAEALRSEAETARARAEDCQRRLESVEAEWNERMTALRERAGRVDELEAEIQRLREETEPARAVASEYAAAYRRTAEAAEFAALPGLRETLNAATQEPVLVDTIQMIGGQPRAGADRILMGRLRQLAQDPRPPVARAAKAALERLTPR